MASADEDALNGGDSIEEVAESEEIADDDENEESNNEGDDLDTIELSLATDEFAELKDSLNDTSTETQDSSSKPKNKSPLACSLCQEICKRGSKMKCCGKKACRGCAVKNVTSNRKCWHCGEKAKTTDVLNDEDLRAKVDKLEKGKKEFCEGLKTGELLKCCICQEICKRGVTTPCCGVAACRGCATKKITGARGCWLESCGQVGVTTEQLVNDMVLREAVDGFKKEGVVNEELAREIKDKRDEMNPVLIKEKEEEKRQAKKENGKKRQEKKKKIQEEKRKERIKKERVLKKLDEEGTRKAPQTNGRGSLSKGKSAESVSTKGVVDLRSKLKTKPNLAPSKTRPISNRNKTTPLPKLTRTIVNRKRAHTPLRSNSHNQTGFFSGTEFGSHKVPSLMDLDRPPRMYSAEEQTKRDLMETINNYKKALIEMGGNMHLGDAGLKNQNFMNNRDEYNWENRNNSRDTGKNQKLMNDRDEYNWENSNNSRDTGRGRMSRKEPLLNDHDERETRKERMPQNKPTFGERDPVRERVPVKQPSLKKSRGKDWKRAAEREMPRFEPGSRTSRDRDFDARRTNKDYEPPRDILSLEGDKEIENLKRDVEKLKKELKESKSSRQSYERERTKRESPRKSHGKDTGQDWNVHQRNEQRDTRKSNQVDGYQLSYPKDNGNIWKDTGRDADPWRGDTGMGGAMKETDTRDRPQEHGRYALPWDKTEKYSSTAAQSWMDERGTVRNSRSSNTQEMMTKSYEVDPWVVNSSSAGPVGKDLDLRSAPPNSASMSSYHRDSGAQSLFNLPPPVPAPMAPYAPSRSQVYQEMSREIDNHMSRPSAAYDSMPPGYKTTLASQTGFGQGYEPRPKTTSSYDSSKWGYDVPKTASFFDELKSREPRLALLDQPRDPRSALLDPSGYGGSTRDNIGHPSSYGMISYPPPKSQAQRRF